MNMPTLGVNIAIIQNGKVLLTKREDFEVWCLPGGGVDAGESVAEAVIRETKEETGLDVRLTRMVGVYSRPHWLENGDHTVLFTAEVVGGNLKPEAREVVDIGFFEPHQLPEPLIWWYREQIHDAVGGIVGVTRTQHIPQPFGKGVSMRELYRIRDKTKIPRQQFFLRHFQTPLIVHPERILKRMALDGR
ncbi:MAG: NUDIX domain-containing protein [Patescibacteria group bacterium]